MDHETDLQDLQRNGLELTGHPRTQERDPTVPLTLLSPPTHTPTLTGQPTFRSGNDSGRTLGRIPEIGPLFYDPCTHAPNSRWSFPSSHSPLVGVLDPLLILPGRETRPWSGLRIYLNVSVDTYVETRTYVCTHSLFLFLSISPGGGGRRPTVCTTLG